LFAKDNYLTIGTRAELAKGKEQQLRKPNSVLQNFAKQILSLVRILTKLLILSIQRRSLPKAKERQGMRTDIVQNSALSYDFSKTQDPAQSTRLTQ